MLKYKNDLRMATVEQKASWTKTHGIGLTNMATVATEL